MNAKVRITFKDGKTYEQWCGKDDKGDDIYFELDDQVVKVEVTEFRQTPMSTAERVYLFAMNGGWEEISDR